jgi:predicted small lipoprotein YifL
MVSFQSSTSFRLSIAAAMLSALTACGGGGS